ncbi:MAG: putative selenium-dependent hydroxylase accessory protein YqeC [Oscillospiraceae bacterium]|nr:putative selenium-dependent hydroxylase accessory protein YqeC [Oscillospiraceae bacterium]
MVISVVGSGGKTTLIQRMAQAYREQNKKVFVTTSTHMHIEPYTLVSDDADSIVQELERTGFVMAGLAQGIKISPVSPETYENVCAHADIVLVEADGSRCLPLKFPNRTEPVIYPNTDEIIVVCGLHALGKPAREVCHRWELVQACLGISEDTIITPEHIRTLVTQGYLIPLREKYPDKTITLHPSNDGSPEQIAITNWLIDTTKYAKE